MLYLNTSGTWCSTWTHTCSFFSCDPVQSTTSFTITHPESGGSLCDKCHHRVFDCFANTALFSQPKSLLITVFSHWQWFLQIVFQRCLFQLPSSEILCHCLPLRAPHSAITAVCDNIRTLTSVFHTN